MQNEWVGEMESLWEGKGYELSLVGYEMAQ